MGNLTKTEEKAFTSRNINLSNLIVIFHVYCIVILFIISAHSLKMCIFVMAILRDLLDNEDRKEPDGAFVIINENQYETAKDY